MAAKNVIIIVVYSPVFCRWFYFLCCAIVLPQDSFAPSAALGADQAMRRGGFLVQCLPGGRAGPAWLGLVPGRLWRTGTISGAAGRRRQRPRQPNFTSPGGK